MRNLIKFGLALSSSLALLFLAPAASQRANAQVAVSSSESNPFSSNLNNNSNTIYNVLPNQPGRSESDTTVLSLTLSFGWSTTNVYPAAPTTCPIAVSSNDLLTTRIPLGCPLPAVLNANTSTNTQTRQGTSNPPAPAAPERQVKVRSSN